MTLEALAAATPRSRDRYVDFLRGASIVAVVFGHWFIGVIHQQRGLLRSWRWSAASNVRAYALDMAQTAPVETERPTGEEVVTRDVPWIVIVWNDPINLMSYVVYVFQKLFGYPREKATKLMLDVHQKGRAVVSEGAREKCEFDVARLHAHGLWATMQKDR